MPRKYQSHKRGRPAPRLPPELRGREVWKPVKGWDYYEVSNCGRIRKWYKILVRKKGRRPEWLWYRHLVNTYKANSGLVVDFYHRAKPTRKLVKHLVADAFLFPQGKKVEFRTRNIYDCRLTNLKVEGQRLDNFVSEGQLDYAFKRIAKGKVGTQNRLAKEFMVDRTSLSKALKRARERMNDGQDQV